MVEYNTGQKFYLVDISRNGLRYTAEASTLDKAVSKLYLIEKGEEGTCHET